MPKPDPYVLRKLIEARIAIFELVDESAREALIHTVSELLVEERSIALSDAYRAMKRALDSSIESERGLT